MLRKTLYSPVSSPLAILFGVTFLWAQWGSPLYAQEATPERPKVPEIPDEPKTVDPVSLIHPKLAQKASVNFNNSSYEELREWLKKTTGLPVVIDEAEFSNEGLSIHDEYSDTLNDAPIYFLLNRLNANSLSWFIEDEVIRITTTLAADDLMRTKTYVIGDLLDNGYDEESLIDTIQEMTGGAWYEIDQEGGDVKLLGDVLFVKQTYHVHLELEGLLSALRKYGRETATSEPELHFELREKLKQIVSVDFEREPIFRVVALLSDRHKLDIRLDTHELANEGISSRDSLSLSIEDRDLKTVLGLLFAELDLTTTLDNGVILITTDLKASEQRRTAVYDVRDLCRNESESDALIEAVQEQTVGPWFEIDQEGGMIASPKPGVLVIRQTNRGLEEVRSLLDAYREALTKSKPRKKVVVEDDVFTHYYKLDTATAEKLFNGLWNLIPEAKALAEADKENRNLEQILMFPAKPELRLVTSQRTKTDNARAEPVLIDQSTMIITHHRSIHKKIQEAINRITNGDSPIFTTDGDPIGGKQGGMQGGGGGFGGGFFSIPEE
ncbi:hypothetical protein [Thalassoglobus polymorphus]|uniref:Uncharacterized protein n=1 Tax=Thalassoglobus polymorphus TaxID=2527994 RepID=A0A517QKX7_9PLAN|nr:hypothetical protein [Thalassoglobus polymorphus]QDT32264.1 hypothetical protein Mal48_15070 [Thalassoglobus polymorphus]